MSHHIRDKEPKAPVIVVQQGNKTQTTNQVDIYHQGIKVASVKFRKSGLKQALQHHVRAWIETHNNTDIQTLIS